MSGPAFEGPSAGDHRERVALVLFAVLGVVAVLLAVAARSTDPTDSADSTDSAGPGTGPAAVSVTLGSAPGGSERPSVTVEPATGLVDHELVEVRGEGFAPGGSVTLFQCAVDDLGDCVSDTAEVDGGGTFTRTVAVSARLCVPHPDDCLEVDPLDEETFESEGIGTVPLSFASDVALVVPSPTTASPTTGLTDGEAIVVRADGWRPGDGIQAATCPSPRPLAPACLAATTGVTDVVDDEGRLRAVVRAGAIVPAGDGSADCRRVPCFLHVGRYPDLTTFALGFAPSAPLAPPPTASARLVEGRTLAVRGEGFVPTEEVFATTCIRRDGPRRCLAPAPVHAAADEDGDVSITYEPGPFPGFAGVGDCRGADCFVLLSGSAAAGPAARDEARAPFAPDP